MVGKKKKKGNWASKIYRDTQRKLYSCNSIFEVNYRWVPRLAQVSSTLLLNTGEQLSYRAMGPGCHDRRVGKSPYKV